MTSGSNSIGTAVRISSPEILITLGWAICSKRTRDSICSPRTSTGASWSTSRGRESVTVSRSAGGGTGGGGERGAAGGDQHVAAGGAAQHEAAGGVGLGLETGAHDLDQHLGHDGRVAFLQDSAADDAGLLRVGYPETRQADSRKQDGSDVRSCGLRHSPFSTRFPPACSSASSRRLSSRPPPYPP